MNNKNRCTHIYFLIFFTFIGVVIGCSLDSISETKQDDIDIVKNQAKDKFLNHNYNGAYPTNIVDWYLKKYPINSSGNDLTIFYLVVGVNYWEKVPGSNKPVYQIDSSLHAKSGDDQWNRVSWIYVKSRINRSDYRSMIKTEKRIIEGFKSKYRLN